MTSIDLSTTDAIRKGIVEFDDEIQKAVYVDNAENRKLGRVGQEYHKGRKKEEEPEDSFSKTYKFKEKKKRQLDPRELVDAVREVSDLIQEEIDEAERYGDDYRNIELSTESGYIIDAVYMDGEITIYGIFDKDEEPLEDLENIIRDCFE